MILRFHVSGIPQAQGSKTIVPIRRGGKVVKSVGRESNRNLGAWRERVIEAASAKLTASALRVEFPSACVRLDAWFFFPRPKGHYGRRGLLPSAPRYMTTKPDLDKLLRAVFDACKEAGIVRDDSAISEIGGLCKQYTIEPQEPTAWLDIDRAPGAIIQVRAL